MGRKRPIRVPVAVTLRGFRATEKAPTALRGQVFSWLQIAGLHNTSARLVDDEGRAVAVDDRNVVARFEDEYQSGLARRMLKRELQRQWKSGAIDLHMQFSPPRRRDYIFTMLFLTALAGALFAAGIPMLRAAWASGPPLSVQILGFSMVLFQVLGVPAVMFSVMIWMIIRQSSPVKALRITRDRIEYTASGRDSQVQPWRNLRARRDNVLLFTDGSRIRLPTKAVRIYELYDLLDADVLGIAPKPVRLATPWMFVRLAIVGLLLGAGALWISHWMVARGYLAGPVPTGRIVSASAMGPAILAMGLLEVYGKRWLARSSRRRRASPPATAARSTHGAATE